MPLNELMQRSTKNSWEGFPMHDLVPGTITTPVHLPIRFNHKTPDICIRFQCCERHMSSIGRSKGHAITGARGRRWKPALSGRVPRFRPSFRKTTNLGQCQVFLQRVKIFDGWGMQDGETSHGPLHRGCGGTVFPHGRVSSIFPLSSPRRILQRPGIPWPAHRVSRLALSGRFLCTFLFCRPR